MAYQIDPIPWKDYPVIDSKKLDDDILQIIEKKYKQDKYTPNYKFTGDEYGNLREALRGAFEGKVALNKFRPNGKGKHHSQKDILSAANSKEFKDNTEKGYEAGIPTSLEWSAIVLAAEAMAMEKGENQEYADDLLNDGTDGMLENEAEATSTALAFWAGVRKPPLAINNVKLDKKDPDNMILLGEKGQEPVPLKDFPGEGRSLKKGEDIPVLGLPENSSVSVDDDVYKKGGLRSVFRGDWSVHPRRRLFSTNAGWGPLESDSALASRVIIRKK